MSNLKGKAWSREELMMAINLYCKTPFGKIHIRNPEIIELANLLGRSPGSVGYKLANFASIDPSLNRKGASNTSKLDVIVWNEFFDNWNKMTFESEKLLSEIRGKTVDDDMVMPKGETKESIIKVRVNQRFFRKMVLSSYGNSCCITGIPVTELLIASHIVPWSVDENNRTNPRNGLCLNSLHDKAFDAGLITIDENYKVLLSKKLKNVESHKIKILTQYDGVTIKMPNRFMPDESFLNFHRCNIFLS